MTHFSTTPQPSAEVVRPTARPPLLEVRNLTIRYPIWKGVLRRIVDRVHAVDNVSFTVHQGEVLGLVGESGCGKTTIAKAICNLLHFTVPGVQQEGQVLLHTEQGPVDLLKLRGQAMRNARAEVQMIFQDPFSSLNPRMTVREIVERPLKVHTKQDARQRQATVASLLERVGLQPEHALRYPHEFSGGQRQRIGIARALAVYPKLIIADEPVSALDVSVQSQVINLLQELQQTMGLAYLFVAHDLSVVHHLSDRIAVMYLGKIIEIGDADAVYRQAQHPYTRALLSAVPHLDRAGRPDRTILKGEIPSPTNRPGGCSFHPRCPRAEPSCATDVPALTETTLGTWAACPVTARDPVSGIG